MVRLSWGVYGCCITFVELTSRFNDAAGSVYLAVSVSQARAYVTGRWYPIYIWFNDAAGSVYPAGSVSRARADVMDAAG